MKKWSPFAVVLVLSLIPAVAGSAAAGETPAPAEKGRTAWTVEDILLAESSSGWEISPDGKWAVWVSSRMDKEKNGRIANLVLTNLETKKETPLTRGSESNTGPKWSPGGGMIAFLSTRPLPKPNPDLARSQLWLISLAGGEPWPAAGFVRSPQAYEWIDEETIIFSASEDPALHEQEAKKRKDTTRVVDDLDHEPPVRLFKLAVKNGTVTRLTSNSDFIQSWAVTPDGRTALAVHGRSLSFDWDHKDLPRTFLHDLASGEAKEILAGRRIIPSQIKAVADGGGFYFGAPYSSDARFFTAAVTRLHYYDLAARTDALVDLGTENGLDGGIETTPDGFIALLAAGIRPQPARFVKKGPAWKRADLRGEHVRNIFDFALSRDARVIVYNHSTASRPSQWFRAALSGSTLTGPVQMTVLNPGFKDKPAARTEVVRWTGALGEEIEGLLYYPRDYEEGKRYSLFTAPHGGPAGADSDSWKESWAYPHQLISQRGAFILKPNYHGSSSYGLAFVESICCGKYYEYPVEDIQKGVEALIARGLVDPDRIGTFGWSNGSILSIALAVADPERYKVVGAGAGNVEFVSDWANVDFGQSFDAYYFGKSPLDDPDFYVRISPFFKLDKVRAPTIIFFGAEDRNVPTSQGWTHYRALYHLKKAPVKFMLFPGEPHSLREYAHQHRKVTEEMAWFDRWFFKTETAAREALKKDSPLGRALRGKSIARSGALYGVKTGDGGILVPEVVRRGAIELGRFEVTRAQFAPFDSGRAPVPGMENHPVTGISFDQAKAYAAWLAEKTGEPWRLPREEEASAWVSESDGENTLDYWAGYALNPDDARRLEAEVEALGGPEALLKEAGSFPGAGADGEELVFDLGGNAAEWVAAMDGSGKAIGGSADRPADPKNRPGPASPGCTGFRVVRGRV